MISPTWAMALNALGVIYGGLETSGVISTLGSSKAGGIAVIILTALNGIAHAMSPPTSGPLAKGPTS